MWAGKAARSGGGVEYVVYRTRIYNYWNPWTSFHGLKASEAIYFLRLPLYLLFLS
jgi:hypothetical protein